MAVSSTSEATLQAKSEIETALWYFRCKEKMLADGVIHYTADNIREMRLQKATRVFFTMLFLAGPNCVTSQEEKLAEGWRPYPYSLWPACYNGQAAWESGARRKIQSPCHHACTHPSRQLPLLICPCYLASALHGKAFPNPCLLSFSSPECYPPTVRRWGRVSNPQYYITCLATLLPPFASLLAGRKCRKMSKRKSEQGMSEGIERVRVTGGGESKLWERGGK